MKNHSTKVETVLVLCMCACMHASVWQCDQIW
jgi:hypothetical protein